MKFGIKEKIIAAGLFGALNDGCAPLSTEPESSEVSQRRVYDEAVKKCRTKFSTTLSPEELRERELQLELSLNTEKKDGTPWLGGLIPYVFAEGVSAEGRNKIMAGMREWQNNTGKIFFVPHTNQADRILFTDNAKPCSADLGKSRLGGEQWVNLSNPSCYNNPGIVLHELGHVIGLIHEHQRPEWERYIVILPENIGEASNYGAKMGLQTNSLPYDFDSVMGYNSYAWVNSFDGKPLERAKNPSILKRDTCEVFETAERTISPQDIQRVNMLYN